MSDRWRVIDTGLRPAAQNIALNRALLEARQAEEIPSTLRFLRFAPSALLGCHQSAGQEFNLEYCKAHNIAIQRRITGGGAIYFDERQLGWELYLHRRDVGTSDMQAIAKRICHAAATAISALGVDARYRPRSDVEVDGRKISGTRGVFDGDALLHQGTLLIDFDVEFHDGELTLTEHARYQTALAEIDTAGWVHLVQRPVSEMPVYEAAQKFAGGLLRASLAYDRCAHRIKQVWFTGDIFVSPWRTIVDLEAALRDTPVERLERNVRAFFAIHAADMLSLTPDDFIAVLRLAVKQPIVAAV